MLNIDIYNNKEEGEEEEKNNNSKNNNKVDNKETNNNTIEKNKPPKPKPKTIDILELDELYSYCYDLKKNEKKRESKYGLLLIGTEIKLLHLK